MPLSKSVNDDGQRWIKGIASTADEDLQGEVVVQKGLDFSYFLKHGYFNNDHKPGFANKVGQPTVCKHTGKGLYVEGYLFKQHDVADDIWEMINSLQASGADRQVGFSIQGKTRRRSGNVILKSWIQDIAITPAPINTKTWVDILKSMAGSRVCACPEVSLCGGCSHCKALSAGHGNPSVTGGVSGEALRVESLDSDDKDQLYGNDHRSKEGRRLSKSQIAGRIQRARGYSYPTSVLFAEVLFKLKDREMA